MAKSRETFNKKEKEKKRLKKKQDKEEKKEARKTSTHKGGDLSDMIAYVDADGNITDTPPDPHRKMEEVDLESIEVSVSRKSESEEEEDTIRKGKISFFNTSKGYGFIKDQITQESIFFHVNGLVDQVAEGDLVTFDTEKTPKGLSAVEVKLAPKA
ncbi:cold shock protein [Lunatimonas lonarensis]|uniref:Cold shock protein n=1 Tax=Lunatimonas lonarensis TaxID=1232681 RepID=R7ZVI4_9BACT|nr:cold shock domain-containing protein [Lunatimonas lonarensis]EON78151.1 cold shock protein [Lunatimonas lonarensis]